MYNYYPCFRQTQGMMPGGQSAPMFPLAPIGTTLPTGMPAGPIMTPMPVPVQDIMAQDTGIGMGTGAGTGMGMGAGMGTGAGAGAGMGMEPETVQGTAFLPGFLRTQIGRNMRVQFLIGTTGPLVDRIGTLLGVGANYIIMRPQESDDILTADLYSIKFVDIFQ